MNPGWLLYNNLSFITPFPNTWDRTSATQTANCAGGAYDAASTNVACKNVEAYLDAQSSNISSYPDALWQSGVTGPWRLATIDDLGNATFVPNQKYSGPQKAQVAAVKLVAFTSTQAEENALQAGTIDLGFVDPDVLTSPAPAPGKVGPNWGNLAQNYNIIDAPLWNFVYAPFNFDPANPKAAAISQLYIRQALQSSVDQDGILTNIDKGYGVPIYSPLPPTTPASIGTLPANPYPFNLTAAKALLTSHGWTEVGGLDTCTSPGTSATECGAGITMGYTLNLSLVWASGYPSLSEQMESEINDWATIGIVVAGSTDTFNNVVGVDCNLGSTFDMCDWGGGWTYAPDYYPSGESLFAPGGGFNIQDYNNATMTSLITATDFGTANLTAYAAFAAQNLPVLYQPANFDPGEVIKTLHSSNGFLNPLGNFMPEYMHF